MKMFRFEAGKRAKMLEKQLASAASEKLAETARLRTDLSFSYRLYRPESATGDTLILLHGSAADETTLVPLAAAIAPRATLVAVQSRISQDGDLRWFRRITPTRFEQGSIRSEASAFAGFMAQLIELHGLDPSQMTFLGYSNGANLISSVMLLHPGPIERVVLLRAMPVLDDVPATDLSRARVLTIAGAADVTYAPFAPALTALLRSHGADVEKRTVRAGHEFGAQDAAIVIDWLAGAAPSATARRGSIDPGVS